MKVPEHIMEKLIYIRDNVNCKVYPASLKRDKEVLETINQFGGLTLSERFYNALKESEPPICEYGNSLKFNSFNNGYKFCGRAGACQCAKESVSKSMVIANAKRTPEDLARENEKRQQTMMDRYGVKSAMGMPHVRKRHEEYFSKQENVDKMLMNLENTMMEKYGVVHSSKSELVKEKTKGTLIERYGVENIAHIPDVKERRQATKRERYEDDHLLCQSYKRMKKKYADECNLDLLVNESDYTGVHNDAIYPFMCIECNYVFDFNVRQISKVKCTNCNPSYGSAEQTELFEYISGIYDGAILLNCRSAVRGIELDIYIPDFKIAIEYNGVYWHNDRVIEDSYHKMKFDKCKENGIRLFSLLSSYWKRNKDAVKHMIKSELLTIERPDVKGSIRITDTEEIMDFFKVYSLTPNVAEINIAVMNETDISAVMSFINANESGICHLINYANKYNDVEDYKCILKYLFETNKISEVKATLNNGFLNDTLFSDLGFVKIGDIQPNDWFVDKNSEKIYNENDFKKLMCEKHDLDESKWNAKLFVDQYRHHRVVDCGGEEWSLYK